MKGTGSKRLAVIGHPVGHSRSPAMQTAALRELGLDREGWSYGALDVVPSRFDERVGGLAAAGYVGANVTIPHKEAALALADRSSERASSIGAANTLSFTGGEIVADNTDAPGFLAAMPRSPERMRALVLGAGGAARAVVWALEEAGARVEVVNRTRERAERLTEEIGGTAIDPGEVDLAATELLVNTTSIGLGSGSGPADQARRLKVLGVEVDQIEGLAICCDLVYGELRTGLTEAATKAGAYVIDGLEILVRQGAASFEIWTGRKAPLDVMRAAARERSAFGEVSP